MNVCRSRLARSSHAGKLATRESSLPDKIRRHREAAVAHAELQDRRHHSRAERRTGVKERRTNDGEAAVDVRSSAPLA